MHCQRRSKETICNFAFSLPLSPFHATLGAMETLAAFDAWTQKHGCKRPRIGWATPLVFGFSWSLWGLTGVLGLRMWKDMAWGLWQSKKSLQEWTLWVGMSFVCFCLSQCGFWPAAVVPFDVLIHCHMARESDIVKKCEASGVKLDDKGAMALCCKLVLTRLVEVVYVFVAGELMKQESSLWYPYFQIVPNPIQTPPGGYLCLICFPMATDFFFRTSSGVPGFSQGNQYDGSTKQDSRISGAALGQIEASWDGCALIYSWWVYFIDWQKS